MTAHRPIIPACDTELTAAYERMAALDGDAAAISHADVDLWVDAVLAIQGTRKSL